MNDDLPGMELVRSRGVVRVVETILDTACVVILILMTGITTVDVIGRYVFHAPLLGAYEASELLLGVLIFSALPRVTWHQQHLTVSLIDAWLGPAARRVQQFVINLISTFMLAVLTFYLWKHATELNEYGDMSNALQVPIAPFAYIIAIMTGIATLAALLKIFSSPRR
ncbi:TRAP transporter small permease [Alcaligenes ammonioxydans]|uniref:TRAP transporter small permease protein n=1 Tax=Alcaligenes ammonioxydans TaxID=2582914 RepID=A0ABX8SNI5_9BURK|nr:TRAP transporter small permease [Alcaligenes ammonioxydans]EJC65113.1 TRAP dicarboxylate transporter subunit DctQ [Alcaligenes faecalis subsp. faecalis NCIB 8687]QBH19586.1 TRAP transporter small permease [Alcaligenes faecalis]MCH1880016.1 TRAP transporter small permease [Alcaligenes ammonioxydans]QXX77595.1 TRAP transporter small permease [Alcaligenes ammonioxydans]WGQ35641.1 TRAP transporter small permease [Alcaligenes faecalis]